MKIIDREMKVVESCTDKSNYSLKCQASFNSDGVLTLRNYNIEDKNSDEIIIFSREETLSSLMCLMFRFKEERKDD